MPVDKPVKRMTLRELLIHTMKNVREVTEHLQADLAPQSADLHNLSRPVRRRSQYPKLIALQNALARLEESHDEGKEMTEALLRKLVTVRQRVRREMRRQEFTAPDQAA